VRGKIKVASVQACNLEGGKHADAVAAAAPEPTLPVPCTAGRASADAFFADAELTYFEFVLACIGLAQVMVAKEQPALAKVCATRPYFERCVLVIMIMISIISIMHAADDVSQHRHAWPTAYSEQS
jgi:hypothetical protein